MAKGYTKRLLAKRPRASERGRIVRHVQDGRIILEILGVLSPRGYKVDIKHHATKGIRITRAAPDGLIGG